MKVWIPGGRGMLGHELALQAKALGHEVVVTGSEVDVTDSSVVNSFVDIVHPGVVINCAAFTAVDLAETHEAAATRVNGDAPGVIGAAAARKGMRALHVSTDYVFDGTSKQVWSPVDETRPLSAYGRSKLKGEGRFLDGTNGNGLVVRTSWLFGPVGKNFLLTMLKLMAERDQLRVVNDQHGRPTSTSTLAAALLELAATDAAGITHCANAGATTWHGFASAIFAEAQARKLPLKVKAVEAIPTSAYPTPAVRPQWSVLDTTRTEKLLGRPLPPWQDALAAVFAALPT